MQGTEDVHVSLSREVMQIIEESGFVVETPKNSMSMLSDDEGEAISNMLAKLQQSATHLGFGQQGHPEMRASSQGVGNAYKSTTPTKATRSCPGNAGWPPPPQQQQQQHQQRQRAGHARAERREHKEGRFRYAEKRDQRRTHLRADGGNESETRQIAEASRRVKGAAGKYADGQPEALGDDERDHREGRGQHGNAETKARRNC